MKRIPLTRGKRTIVDDEDYAHLSQWNWYAQFSGSNWTAQRAIQISGKWGKIRMHRYLMCAPKGLDVDHINRDSLDNRKANLRVCTRSENGMNRGAPKHNCSGYKGVSFNRRTGKYQAYIKVDGKQRHLGLFRKASDAARAYDTAAVELHGEFAAPNFPEPT